MLSLVGVKRHSTAEDPASRVLVFTKNTPESGLDTTQLCSPYENWKNSCLSSQPFALLLHQICCCLGIWGWKLVVIYGNKRLLYSFAGNIKSKEAGCPVPLNMPEQRLYRAGRYNMGLIGDPYLSAARARGSGVPMFRHLN